MGLMDPTRARCGGAQMGHPADSATLPGGLPVCSHGRFCWCGLNAFSAVFEQTRPQKETGAPPQGLAPVFLYS